MTFLPQASLTYRFRCLATAWLVQVRLAVIAAVLGGVGYLVYSYHDSLQKPLAAGAGLLAWLGGPLDFLGSLFHGLGWLATLPFQLIYPPMAALAVTWFGPFSPAGLQIAAGLLTVPPAFGCYYLLGQLVVWLGGNLIDDEGKAPAEVLLSRQERRTRILERLALAVLTVFAVTGSVVLWLVYADNLSPPTNTKGEVVPVLGGMCGAFLHAAATFLVMLVWVNLDKQGWKDLPRKDAFLRGVVTAMLGWVPMLTALHGVQQVNDLPHWAMWFAMGLPAYGLLGWLFTCPEGTTWRDALGWPRRH